MAKKAKITECEFYKRIMREGCYTGDSDYSYFEILVAETNRWLDDAEREIEELKDDGKKNAKIIDYADSIQAAKDIAEEEESGE